MKRTEANELEDLRRNDFYLTPEEREEWDKNNVLYNTVWFYVNKSCIMPDMEYSDKAIEIYKSQEHFEKWGVMYHHHGGKNLIKPDNSAFNADIMTGWWNPFKYLIGKESRKHLTEELLGKIPKSKSLESDFDELGRQAKINELAEKKTETWKALIDFLRVVYTAGNIIPAPRNWVGNGLDGWDNKLECIFNGPSDTNTDSWRAYIFEEYAGKKDEDKYKTFISENKLEMYFDKNNEIISFWGGNRPKSFNTATEEQWKEYFENAQNCIESRGKMIVKPRQEQ